MLSPIPINIKRDRVRNHLVPVGIVECVHMTDPYQIKYE